VNSRERFLDSRANAEGWSPLPGGDLEGLLIRWSRASERLKAICRLVYCEAMPSQDLEVFASGTLFRQRANTVPQATIACIHGRLLCSSSTFLRASRTAPGDSAPVLSNLPAAFSSPSFQGRGGGFVASPCGPPEPFPRAADTPFLNPSSFSPPGGGMLEAFRLCQAQTRRQIKEPG